VLQSVSRSACQSVIQSRGQTTFLMIAVENPHRFPHPRSHAQIICLLVCLGKRIRIRFLQHSVPSVTNRLGMWNCFHKPMLAWSYIYIYIYILLYFLEFVWPNICCSARHSHSQSGKLFQLVSSFFAHSANPLNLSGFMSLLSKR